MLGRDFCDKSPRTMRIRNRVVVIYQSNGRGRKDTMGSRRRKKTLNDPWEREAVERLSGGGGGSVTRSKDNRGLGKNKEPRSAGNQKNSIMNTNNLLFDILRFGAFWVADQKRPSLKTEPIRTTIKTSSFPLSCGHPESAE